jgi:fatty acid desaturase
MTPRSELTSHSDYAKELRRVLPAEAFAAAPRKLWLLFAHLLIIAGGYIGFCNTSSLLIFAILSLLIGHSMACIAFLAHELSHNTIVRYRPLRYCLEVFFWALNLIPATVWRRVHNQTHHVHTNTPEDPDRQFLASEESFITRWYSRIFYPHRHTLRWNPLVAFHFVPYILRNTIAAFYPNSTKPALVPFKPSYTFKQRVSIFFELAVIVGVQIGIFHIVGARWVAYFWASPIVVLLTSAVVMAYVFTNHFLNPLGEINDPLAATTSIVVSPLFDRLHSNFSYHTEHHLFPQMNSDFYLQVSKLLEQQYPGRYHRVPIGEAWHTLWTGEEYVPNSTNETQP